MKTEAMILERNAKDVDTARLCIYVPILVVTTYPIYFITLPPSLATSITSLRLTVRLSFFLEGLMVHCIWTTWYFETGKRTRKGRKKVVELGRELGAILFLFCPWRVSATFHPRH